ncbi:hypothetical protein [Flavobacterium sp. KMS]|uniref:toxin-antitoxin system YwqK family antitoxin n=1 Tax=Flavobacterium sp. KMS TaxID=1566023 RepID=UPI000A807E3B|nr:hypothetical protein [Flavobacterium sp. KMS]
MKANIFSRNILFFFAFTLVSFSDPYTIKRISDKDFRYEFYTTDKKIKPEKDKIYHWFKGGLIHEAQGGAAGDLLNDKFIKMYHSNQLAEQGKYKNGLRVGLWKTWYPNGVIATTQMWVNGLRSGIYSRYDKNGDLIENGDYTADKKTGKWTNTESKDTLIYKKGVIVIKKQSLLKSEKYKLKQDKLKLEESIKEQKKSEATIDAAKLTEYKTKTENEKKLAKEKAKKEKEQDSLNKKMSEPKKESKIINFFKNIFKKKDRLAQ